MILSPVICFFPTLRVMSSTNSATSLKKSKFGAVPTPFSMAVRLSMIISHVRFRMSG